MAKFGDPRLPERFWAKVSRSGECWLWNAAKAAGYGRFVIDGRMQGAHRVSYAALVGPIPQGMQVDHKCWTRACVNPEHLRLATNAQNGQNRSGSYSNSGNRGVYWHARDRKWIAHARLNGEYYHGGSFDGLEEAKAAAVALRSRLFAYSDADR